MGFFAVIALILALVVMIGLIAVFTTFEGRRKVIYPAHPAYAGPHADTQRTRRGH